MQGASVVAVSHDFFEIPPTSVMELPESLRDSWADIDWVHAVGMDFLKKPKIPSERDRARIFGRMAEAVESLRNSDATWRSEKCANAFWPLAVNLLRFEWMRGMSEKCLLMFASMGIVYPRTSEEAVRVLRGKRDIAQVGRCSHACLHHSPLDVVVQRTCHVAVCWWVQFTPGRCISRAFT